MGPPSSALMMRGCRSSCSRDLLGSIDVTSPTPWWGELPSRDPESHARTSRHVTRSRFRRRRARAPSGASRDMSGGGGTIVAENGRPVIALQVAFPWLPLVAVSGRGWSGRSSAPPPRARPHLRSEKGGPSRARASGVEIGWSLKLAGSPPRGGSRARCASPSASHGVCATEITSWREVRVGGRVGVPGEIDRDVGSLRARRAGAIRFFQEIATGLVPGARADAEWPRRD